MLVVIAAGLLAGGGGAQTPRRPHAAARDLGGSFRVVPGSPGAGQITYRLRLTNTSSAACWVSGIPQLRLLGAKGGALPTTVSAAYPGQATAARIVLRPGRSAKADARFSPDVPGVRRGSPREPVRADGPPPAGHGRRQQPDGRGHPADAGLRARLAADVAVFRGLVQCGRVSAHEAPPAAANAAATRSRAPRRPAAFPHRALFLIPFTRRVSGRRNGSLIPWAGHQQSGAAGRTGGSGPTDGSRRACSLRL